MVDFVKKNADEYTKARPPVDSQEMQEMENLGDQGRDLGKTQSSIEAFRNRDMIDLLAMALLKC